MQKLFRLSFKDNNPLKAYTLLNGIDTLYLQYSNEQKNLANKQKIDWLANELRQIEIKMGEYEDYFENFTLKNKTSDLKEDLKKTISQINRIDSQRFELTKRVNEVNVIMYNISTGNFYQSALQQNSLPPSLNKSIEQFQVLYLEMDRMKLSYNETTFAYKQKEKEIQSVQNTVSHRSHRIQGELTYKASGTKQSKKFAGGCFCKHA